MKQLPSQWRGEGRENVIEFRQARAELLQAHEHVQQAVPNAKAEVISLEAERERRAQARQQIAEPMQGQQQGEQQKSGGEDTAAAGGIMAILLAGFLSMGWQRHQVEQLKGERAALLDEVAQLQVQAEDWAKRGGRAKLETCGEQRRLCVRIDTTAGFGKDGDYFVLRGY